MMTPSGRHIEIRGTVQGVGFRPAVFRIAHEIGIRGVVWNDACGVSIDAYGTPNALDCFLDALRSDSPPASRVRSLTWAPIPFADHASFSIRSSTASGERHVSIPADL